VKADREALTVAMAVVPGLYSRNKNFAMYGDADVRKARARAALLRGIVRQLSGAHGDVTSLHMARGEERCELSYAIESIKLDRKVSLTTLEASCLAYLATRAGIAGVAASEHDRAHVDGALKRLAIGLRLPGVEA
jgi:hypothetical protein